MVIQEFENLKWKFCVQKFTRWRMESNNVDESMKVKMFDICKKISVIRCFSGFVIEATLLLYL